jgi:hypothetical protein
MKRQANNMASPLLCMLSTQKAAKESFDGF